MRCDKFIWDTPTFALGSLHGADDLQIQSVMLSSISWQQYFAAIATISISYYLYVIVRYYQREISTLFSAEQIHETPISTASFSPVNVMGQKRQDQNISTVDDQDLKFADHEEIETLDPELRDPSSLNSSTQTLQQQMLIEMDKLIGAFVEIDNKVEFISLLVILINAYHHYEAEIDLAEVAQHVCTNAHAKLKFDVSMDDLPKTWNKQ